MEEQYNEGVDTELPGGEQTVETPENVPQEGAQTPEAAPQAVQPVWNGTEWAYQYKGQQFVPKSREHLLALAQKGHGFNSEYDRLKQERQQFESTRSQYDKYAQLDQLFQQHPELQQKINNVVYEHRNGKTTQIPSNGGNGAEVDPTVLEQRQILEQTRGLYEQLTAAQADKQLDDEIGRLKQSYPGDWTTDTGDGTLEKRILSHALKGQFPTLEAAYRDYHWDSIQAQAKAEALRTNKMGRQNDFRAGKAVQGVNASPAPAKPVDVKKMSYNQIADAISQGQLI